MQESAAAHHLEQLLTLKVDFMVISMGCGKWEKEEKSRGRPELNTSADVRPQHLEDATKTCAASAQACGKTSKLGAATAENDHSVCTRKATVGAPTMHSQPAWLRA